MNFFTENLGANSFVIGGSSLLFLVALLGFLSAYRADPALWAPQVPSLILGLLGGLILLGSLIAKEKDPYSWLFGMLLLLCSSSSFQQAKTDRRIKKVEKEVQALRAKQQPQ